MFKKMCLCLLVFYSSSTYAQYQMGFELPKETAQIPEDILLLGKNALDLRLRYEHVTDKSYQQLARYPKYAGQGITLEAMLNFQTARFYESFFELEFNHVAVLFPDHFNSGFGTTPEKISYAQIPDPKGTALTQGYIGYLGLDDTLLLLGRQYLVLDNQRFVGNEDFRQTPQTFDAITIVNRSLNNVELFYSYVAQVNSIYQGASTADFPSRQNNTHLINVSSELKPFGTVIGYVYLIDDKANPFLSNATYGLRYLDDLDIYQLNLYFLGEFAYQNDYQNQPIHYNAFYTHCLTGLKGYGADLRVGQEILSGNKAAGKQFRTPLGSQHEFNGKTDQFTITPNLGLIDWYGQLELNYWAINLVAEYHHFNSQRGSAKYGHEWDLSISRPFFKYYYLGLSVADFSGRSDFNFADVRKFWVTLGAQIP